MPSLRRFALPSIVAALLLAPTTSAAAAGPPPATQAVVNLTYDVTLSWLVAASTADESYGSSAGYTATTYSRPTAAPMPASSPFTQDGLKLSPGDKAVVSVFSRKRANDSACITGTSTKTAAVVYLSTVTGRPTLKRPHGCAKPGAKPLVIPPSKAVIAAGRLDLLSQDLRTMSIAEQSYATDNNGAYVGDTVSRPSKAYPPADDVLVMQGAMLNVGDTVVATLFTTDVTDDSYCLTGTSSKTHQVLYLSSYDDNVTKHRPRGCVAG